MLIRNKKLWIGGALVAAAIAAGGTGIAVATGGGDDANETPITGEALDKASAAALAHTGGGRVTGTEAGDEDGAYEVEVTLDDGRQVDVHLDASASNVVSERDDDDTVSDDGPGDEEDAPAAGAAAGGAAPAGSDDDANDTPDPPIPADALDRATAAALAHVGGGTVTETKSGGEHGAYEVEITLADGREVDVHLDASFNVVPEVDDDGTADDTDGDDDASDDEPEDND
jgi:uncharacterized membrane protein YkoI